MGRIREQQIERLSMNPEHSEYCNCECPEGNSFNKLQETLNRVRMVHVYDVVDDTAFCKACPNDEPDGYKWQEWPCETMRALEGSE
jgi:hypothetical protein